MFINVHTKYSSNEKNPIQLYTIMVIRHSLIH